MLLIYFMLAVFSQKIYYPFRVPASLQFLYYAFYKHFIYFVVSWDWLSGARFYIFVPIMISAVPDEYCTICRDYPNQIIPLYISD